MSALFFLCDCYLTSYFVNDAVRGMMYYRRALMLQSYLEKRYLGGGYTVSSCLLTKTNLLANLDHCVSTTRY
jgi:hypothetical protein